MSILSKCKLILDAELIDGAKLKEQIRNTKTIRELMHVYLGHMLGDIDSFITLLEHADSMPQPNSAYKFPYWE